MSVKQISVFLENKPGALSGLIQVLADNGIDMRAFSLAEASDFGIARIIVDDLYTTTTVLRDAGFIHSVSEALAAAIPNVPGGLRSALDALRREEINIEYMYAFLGGNKDQACMVFKVGNCAAAAAALTRAGIPLLSQEELSDW